MVLPERQYDAASTLPEVESRPAHPPAPRRRRKARVNPFVAVPVAAVLVVALTLGYVAQRAQVMTFTFQLRELTGELERAQHENRRLQLEHARGRSLERVETLARTQLGMAAPQQTEVIVLAPAVKPPTAGQGDQVAARPESAGVQAAAASGSEGETSGLWAIVAEWANQRWPGSRSAEAGRLGR